MSTSPTKELKEKRALKKSFDAKKKALAEQFLKNVDDKIAKGEVGLKCANTGGVKIVWSKTLRTTAGMAKWKLDKLRLPNGHVAMGDHELADLARHHATIELSEKVVDNEGRFTLFLEIDGQRPTLVQKNSTTSFVMNGVI